MSLPPSRGWLPTNDCAGRLPRGTGRPSSARRRQRRCAASPFHGQTASARGEWCSYGFGRLDGRRTPNGERQRRDRGEKQADRTRGYERSTPLRRRLPRGAREPRLQGVRRDGRARDRASRATPNVKLKQESNQAGRWTPVFRMFQCLQVDTVQLVRSERN